MKQFEVQSVEIQANYDVVFDYISNAKNLPEWTNAFESVSESKAMMLTPSGGAEVELLVAASRQQGTIDWCMTFIDGSRANAYSRIVRSNEKEMIYSFILLPPPVSLGELEGGLDQQSQILKEELRRLSNILKEAK